MGDDREGLRASASSASGNNDFVGAWLLKGVRRAAREGAKKWLQPLGLDEATDVEAVVAAMGEQAENEEVHYYWACLALHDII